MLDRPPTRHAAGQELLTVGVGEAGTAVAAAVTAAVTVAVLGVAASKRLMERISVLVLATAAAAAGGSSEGAAALSLPWPRKYFL